MQLEQASRSQSANTSPTPIALPLIAEQPLSLNHRAQSGDTPKAIGHHVELHHNSHPGIVHAGIGHAEPLTWQQLESEMSLVEQNLKESSTTKDGISTWILLSGSDKNQNIAATPATATTIAHVDKINVKDSLNDKHSYHHRLEELPHAEKTGKPMKHREPTENNNQKKQKPDKKNKNQVNATNIIKNTMAPSSTLSSILLAHDFTTESKNRRKPPTIKFAPLNKRKTITPVTPISTTTSSTETPFTTNRADDEHTVTEVQTEATTPVAFIVLEPKDADFDLPQDRSPSTRKPNAHKSKRKPNKKNKTTSITKTPTKLKEKPISSTIYSYLSREVMPTVGVGLMGLVLTAGIASYLFGPLGALRRSYDDASDRQDNVDSIYSVNSEEYANEGTDNGQNEEEIFGKFLAGMPANYVPRYVKYFRPDSNYSPSQSVNGNNNNNNNNYPYRRVNQQQPQAQASNVVPKYSSYMRYRTPSPHYNSAQYNPQQQYSGYRNHHMPNSQPLPQQQSISPVYTPQYHEMQKQKSFVNNMDTILKHQTTIYGKKNGGYASSIDAIQEEKSGGGLEIKDQEESQPTQMLDEKQEPAIDVIENEADDKISSKIQRRTNTYVVGSEAVVSASMSAMSASDDLPKENIIEAKEIVEPVITVTAASHGPRRRKRDTNDTNNNGNELVNETSNTTSITTTTTTTLSNESNNNNDYEKQNEKENEQAVEESTTTASSPLLYSTRLYSLTEFTNLESEFNMLQEKIMSFDREYSNTDNEKRVEKKIQTEFRSIQNDYDALKKAIDGAKAIEQFQRQIRIRAKNFELSIALKTGISNIRQRIKYLTELVEHPDDDRIIEKINRRDGNGNVSSTESTSNTKYSSTTTISEHENGFVGFLKLLQLKAQFGLNLLQNIRPSFERAFEDVFKRPFEKQN